MSDVLLGKYRLALDPGGTTGVAIRFPDGSWMTCTTGDPPSLWKFFQDPKPDEVIFELFSTMGRVDRYMLYTVELVGGIKALCNALDIIGYAHTPQQRKAFIVAAKELLESRKKDHKYVIHEVDALAHLLYHEYRLSNPQPTTVRPSKAVHKSKYA